MFSGILPRSIGKNGWGSKSKMAYRHILIENPAKLSVNKEQLVINTDEEYSVPLEDIESVLVESRQTVVTSYALSEMAERGICFYTCDYQHIPCGVLLPYCQHSRQLGVIERQISLSKPFQKQLWKQIVEQKIRNQAKCLELCQCENSNRLSALSEKVRSGDPENVEGTAASVYFKSLFGKDFSRGQESPINAALNYGYAIMRGMMARHLALYGFLPSMGIHHCSELNAYNLADDFMEPFRPVVDLCVAGSMQDEETFDRSQKLMLYNLLNMDMLDGKDYCTVAYSMERMVKSFSSCCKKEKTELLLPELIPLKPHCYE